MPIGSINARWDKLRAQHRRQQPEIRARLEDFRRVPPDRFFHELVYCLLTPQSSAVHAGRVQEKLEQFGFREKDLNPLPFLRQKGTYIRFHRTKSRRLLAMKAQYPEIQGLLASSLSAFDIRERLVRQVKGLGYKEATHFLRNIGKNQGLAILDRHILRNLVEHRVIRSIPPTLTRKRYLALEAAFQRFAAAIGIPIDEMDLLFWSRQTGQILK